MFENVWTLFSAVWQAFSVILFLFSSWNLILWKSLEFWYRSMLPVASNPLNTNTKSILPRILSWCNFLNRKRYKTTFCHQTTQCWCWWPNQAINSDSQNHRLIVCNTFWQIICAAEWQKQSRQFDWKHRFWKKKQSIVVCRFFIFAGVGRSSWRTTLTSFIRSFLSILWALTAQIACLCFNHVDIILSNRLTNTIHWYR